MPDAVGTSRIDIVANTAGFTHGMRRATKHIGGFRLATRQASMAVKGLMTGLGGISSMGGVMGFAGMGYGAVRFAGSVEKLNQSFHSSLAIMGDVSSAMKSKMVAATMDVAKTTRYSADQIAKSYFYLASAGLNAQQSLTALPTVAKFAQAGMFDMARATDLLTDAQSALGLTAKDSMKNMKNMTKVSDALVKANTLANASVEQFSLALTTKAGASLRMVNKSIEEGLAALSVYADQGVKGAEAGTALSIVMRDLQTKAIKNEEAFNRMNVRVFDAQDNMRNLSDIVRDLEMAMGGLSDFAKKKIILDLGFSDKSVNFLLQLIGKSSQMRTYERKLERAKGTTDEVAEKQMTEWMKSWNKISAGLMQFGEKYVLPLVNTLGKNMGAAADNGDLETAGRIGTAGANMGLSSLKAAQAMNLRAMSWGAGMLGYDNFANAAGGLADERRRQMTEYRDMAAYGRDAPHLADARLEESNLARAKKQTKLWSERIWASADSLADFASDRGLDLGMPKRRTYGPVDPRSTAKYRATMDAWAEEQKAADEAAKKMRTALEEGGKVLTLSMRTPLEVHAEAMKTASKMLKEGVISAETFTRARMAAISEMSVGGGANQANNAIEYGTQAYYANEARRQQAAIQSRHAEEQIALLEEISDKLGDEN